MSVRPGPGAGFAVCLGAVTLVSPLAVHLFLPVMPAVKSAFAISDALVEATFSVTLVTMAVATLVYGTLSDWLGRRRVLLAGLALFVLGSAVSAVADSVALLILGRLTQAAGAACGLTLTRAIARDAYGPEALVKAIAYLTMAYTLGPMIAPPLGGILMDHFGWRSSFWFALVSGIAITVAAYLVIYETRSHAERRESHGSVLHAYATLGRNPRFMAYVLQSGFMSFQFFAIAAASPLLMKDLLHQTATQYGLYFLFFPLGYFTGNLISGRLSGRASIETMMVIGASMAMVVVTGQATLILAGYLSPLLLFVPGGLISFSQGLALPNAQAGAMRVLPSLAGTAAGIGVFFQMLLSGASAELYGLTADGTPIPMLALMVAGTLLSLGCGIYVFATRVAPTTDAAASTVGKA